MKKQTEEILDTVKSEMEKQEVKEEGLDTDKVDESDAQAGIAGIIDVKVDLDKYLVAVGMDCADKTIQTLKDNDRGLHVSQKMERVINAYDTAEQINAVLIPFQAEDLVELLDNEQEIKINAYKECVRPNDVRFSLSYYLDPVKTDDDIYDEELFHLSSEMLTVSMPNDEEREWIMFIFYGDIAFPDAGITVGFQNCGNGSTIAIASGMGKSVAQTLNYEYRKWLDQGTWYTKENLLDAVKNCNREQRKSRTSDITDVNKFAIDVAVSLNERFIFKLLSHTYMEWIETDTEISREDIESVAESLSTCDTGIIMPDNEFLPYAYIDSFVSDKYVEKMFDIASQTSSELASNIFTTYSLPDVWDEDICVMLGNQNDEWCAEVIFKKAENNFLTVSYSLLYLGTNEKFMHIQKILNKYGDEIDETFTCKSPYGKWSEYDGIKNIGN